MAVVKATTTDKDKDTVLADHKRKHSHKVKMAATMLMKSSGLVDMVQLFV